MSLSYFHERDLGQLGIPADVQWVGTDRLAVHLSPDSLDRLVEGYEDEDELAERLDEANEDGYEVGKAEMEQEWRDRLSDLQSSWRRGGPAELVCHLGELADELGWGESPAFADLDALLDDV